MSEAVKVQLFGPFHIRIHESDPIHLDADWEFESENNFRIKGQVKNKDLSSQKPIYSLILQVIKEFELQARQISEPSIFWLLLIRSFLNAT